MITFLVTAVAGIALAQNAIAPASVEITVVWANADPEQIELEITTPLEKRLKTLPRVSTIRSSTSPGRTQIVVEMSAGDMQLCFDVAAVASAVRDAQSSLPVQASAPTIVARGAKCG